MKTHSPIYEVERKYRVCDDAELRQQIAQRGGEFSTSVLQCDQYFAHPARDFAVTDEALRIRTVADTCVVTYKGPKVDATSKTRQELEIQLPRLDPRQPDFAQLLGVLGFTPIAKVRKHRSTACIALDGRQFEVALDDVDGLGLFVELETSATTADLPAALRALDQLTSQLHLANDERRSYLELLLEHG